MFVIVEGWCVFFLVEKILCDKYCDFSGKYIDCYIGD